MTPRPRTSIALVASALLALVLVLAGCGSTGESAASDDGGSGAAAEPVGELTVERVAMDWPANPATAALYLTIRNPTPTADALVAVSTPIAEQATVHRSTEDDEGRSVMEAQPRLQVPARATVTFEPGSLHVMLTGITERVEVGDEVPVTFTFERAGTVDAVASVTMPGTAYADPDTPAEEGDHGH